MPCRAISRLRGRPVRGGYVGAFGRVNRVDLVVEAAIEAERRQPGRVGLVVVGEGPERPVIERAAGGHASVVVGRPIARRFVPTVLRELDAAVVHTTYTPVYRYGISFNKLFEYMAAESTHRVRLRLSPMIRWRRAVPGSSSLPTTPNVSPRRFWRWQGRHPASAPGWAQPGARTSLESTTSSGSAKPSRPSSRTDGPQATARPRGSAARCTGWP